MFAVVLESCTRVTWLAQPLLVVLWGELGQDVEMERFRGGEKALPTDLTAGDVAC